MIKCLRVDHRLLHGQVAFSWTSALGADCILIANDALMQDELKKMAIKMAKPQGVKLVLKNIDDAIQSINSGVTDKYKLFIVVESVKDAYRLMTETHVIDSVVLGGTKATAETKNISKAVNLTEKEIELVKHINEFRNEIIESAKQRAPHKITNYIQKLAQLFHSFYNDCYVIDEENKELSSQRLALVKASQMTLKNALNLVGVSAPEKM